MLLYISNKENLVLFIKYLVSDMFVLVFKLYHNDKFIVLLKNFKSCTTFKSYTNLIDIF